MPDPPRRDEEYWRRAILRDLETILTKDDDLRPDEIDEESDDGRAWRAARDDLVDEFARRGRAER